MAKKEDKIVVSTDKQYLKCDLTQGELLKYGEESARAMADIRIVEDRLAAIKKDLQSQIDTKEARIRELSGKIVSKTEFRDVVCEKTINYTKGRVKVVRTDTGAVIEDRDLNDSERQTKLFKDEHEPLQGRPADTVAAEKAAEIADNA